MNHPLTVLIVDDEVPIREELKAFSWEESHAVCVGDAKNGEEALRLCRFYAPDVVVTDISMPVMDGLQLFRALKEELPETKVIVLTCHSDFQYAQQALQLGAVDYILKVTMTDRHLQQALEKARIAIEKEQSHREQTQYRFQYGQARQLRRWLSKGPQERGPMTVEMAETGLCLRYPLELTMLHTIGHEQDLLFTDMEILGYTNHALKADPQSAAVLPYGPGKCLILREQDTRGNRNWATSPDRSPAPNPGDTNESKAWTVRCELPDLATPSDVPNADPSDELQWASLLVSGAYNSISAKFPFLRHELRLFAAISDTVNDDVQLVQALKWLEQGNMICFYEPQQRVFTVAEAGGIEGQQMDTAAKDLESAMRRAMKNPQSLVRFIRSDLPAWAAANRPDPDKLKELVHVWRKEWFPHRTEAELHAVQQRIRLADSLAALVEELADEVGSMQDHKVRHEVAQAKQLIADKLAEDITLSQIAGYVGLRDHYFSRLFRQETGESFNEYVMRLRMDKALLLLATTSLKVYEIAEQVGIPNYRYFYVLFRKWTGSTPTDYKKG